MANITKKTDRQGNPVYKICVSNGRSRRKSITWRPEPGWSARTVERELHKAAAQLENDLAAGKVLTRAEKLERQRREALEASRLKTVRQYAAGVFMPTKEASFSENSRASYQMFLDRHILPAIGEQNLADVTPAMLTRLLTDFQRQGHAHASVIKLYQILNGLFKMAFLDESIANNPMLRVQRPKPRKGETGKDEREKAYTVEEVRYILQCLEREPLKWRVYIALLIDTGARKGEACGLQWGDIDFTAGALTIQRSLQYTREKGVYVTSPKNGKSRTVDVGREVLHLLARLREQQAQTALSRWVFTQEESPEPMQPQTPTHYFKKLEKRYGIPDFHPHKLRHTSASIGITNGADVVSVSQRLGHSDSAVTLRMYAHANEESIRRAGQIVRDALKGDAAAH